ncbi:MAG: formate dehydrogenase accessory sulfurtransferase FdhD [Acidithiobacillus ferrivorans]
MAIDVAQRCGITLIGFVRDRRMTIYLYAWQR